MTAETIAAGWALTIGAILILAGAVVVTYVRSARAERRAAVPPREVLIRRISEAAVVTPKDAGGIDDLWLELLTTPRIPAQRNGNRP